MPRQPICRNRSVDGANRGEGIPVPQHNARNIWQFLRYSLVGAVNTVCGYAIIFTMMYGLGASPEISNATGYSVCVFFSYFANRVFTFGSNARVHGEMPKFFAVFAISYLLNLAILVMLVRVLGVHEGVSQLLAGVVYIGASFLLMRCWVFSGEQS